MTPYPRRGAARPDRGGAGPAHHQRRIPAGARWTRPASRAELGRQPDRAARGAARCSPPRAWSTPGRSAAPSSGPAPTGTCSTATCCAGRSASAPTDGFLEDLAEVRAIIEPAAARLAAARRTDADLDAMEAGAGRDGGGGRRTPTRWSRPTSPSTAPCWPPPTTNCSAGWRWSSRPACASATGSCTAPGTATTPSPCTRTVLDAVEAGDPDAAAAAVELTARSGLRRPGGRPGAGRPRRRDRHAAEGTH